MANGVTHQIAGALAGAGICLLDNASGREHQYDFFAAGVAGALAGKLPDKLEPALHPNHRQFFHSFLVFGMLGYGMKKTYEWVPESTPDIWIRRLLLVAGASYLSHLALDALTMKSLPIVGSV